jgi:uncharacterized protein
MDQYHLESVFVLPVGRDWLVYSPLRQTAALANTKAVAALKAERHLMEAKRSRLASILNNSPLCAISNRQGDLNPQFLGIVPTRACNLSCVYCDFDASCASSESLKPELAVESIDWWALYQSVRSRDTLEVHFFGGEPFHSFDVVELAVHRVRQQAGKYGLRPILEVSTNGFFSESCCDFVGDYFNSVVLSLDGPEHIQNRHRPMESGQGSFARVYGNAKRLSASQADLCLRVCCTDETVRELAAITEWMCTALNPVAINFETLKKTPQSQKAQLNTPNPFDFAQSYLAAIEVAKRYGVTPVYAASSLTQLQTSFCPVGKDVIILTPDGTICGCYLPERQWLGRQMDMRLGRFVPGRGMNIDQESVARLRNYTKGKSQCQKCLARYHCAGGCHVSQPPLFDATEYNDFCIQTRIITTAALLETVGASHLIQGLVANRGAMASLARRPSDLLSDWEANTTVECHE